MTSQLPAWVQYLQAFTTLAIAVLAVAIAFGQWQANRAKLAVDLYDRRFALFMEVRRMISLAIAHAKMTDPGLPNEVLAQGRYCLAKTLS